MSAKNCQLCGKPLGRMRADGDFCSREHRHQFRLRQGLDRLEEAGKVATMMRRRENARPIPASRLAAGSVLQYRPLLAPARFEMEPVERRLPALTPTLFAVRIHTPPGEPINPLAAATRRAASVRSVIPCALPVEKTAAKPVLGALVVKRSSTGMAQAPSVRATRALPAPPDSPRECGAALRVSRTVVAARGPIAMTTTESAALESTQRMRDLPAAEACALPAEVRESEMLRFARRAPVMRPRRPDLPAPQQRGVSKDPQALLPSAQDIAAERRACAIPRQEQALRLPAVEPPPITGHTSRSEPIPLQPVAYETTPGEMRACAVFWTPVAEPATPRTPDPLVAARSVGRANLIEIPSAARAASAHRHAEVRFTPEAAPTLAPVSFHDAMGPSGSEATRPVPIEENFNAGLDLWAGDTTEWRLDAAGARPAGLALFKPTLNLSDYEFEFFARIETRTVNFVFRAANTSNYLRVTIAMVESGRYELRRSAVIGGVEEHPVATPLPGVIRPGTAFSVRVRAWQNDFSVWLDGQVAARWTDGRMPTGGIGFLAPRNDRARVYWVKLSQDDSASSPAAAPRPSRSIQ